MDIAIDGVVEGVPLSSNPSVGDLFAGLRGWCGSRKRVLVSVLLDGRTLELRPGREAEPLPQGAKLEAATRGRAEFVARMLGDLESHLRNLAGAHQEAGRLTVAGNYDAALKAFGTCFQGWSLLTAALQELARHLEVDFRSLPVSGTTAEAVILKAVEALGRFRNAFQKRDVVLLGDLSQYELGPLVGEWGHIRTALAERSAART